MADKVVKCVLLNVDNVLITEIEEVMPEPGEPDCRLVNPYLFVSEDDMKPWGSGTQSTTSRATVGLLQWLHHLSTVFHSRPVPPGPHIVRGRLW